MSTCKKLKQRDKEIFDITAITRDTTGGSWYHLEEITEGSDSKLITQVKTFIPDYIVLAMMRHIKLENRK